MGNVGGEKKEVILQPRFNKQNMMFCTQAGIAASPNPSMASCIPEITTFCFWRCTVGEQSRALSRGTELGLCQP